MFEDITAAFSLWLLSSAQLMNPLAIQKATKKLEKMKKAAGLIVDGAPVSVIIDILGKHSSLLQVTSIPL
ncbi:MAG: hypothetical protein R3D43_09050 [Tepidamorphaceae bacterium]